jgi:hypothetical protein
VNPSVYYAYKIVVSPEKVTMVDSIILHLLGVLWSDLTGETLESSGEFAA